MSKVNRIIFVATPHEVAGLTDETKELMRETGTEIRYTRIGKVNAAVAVTRELWRHKPIYALNVGTAGFPDFKDEYKDDWDGKRGWKISFVEQRDMDATNIMRQLRHPETNELLFPDFPVKQTPFGDEVLGVCDRSIVYSDLPGFHTGTRVCSTGDNTKADIEDTYHTGALVEMEGYACWAAFEDYLEESGNPFRYDILKWMSDTADSETVGEEWDKYKASMPINEIIQRACTGEVIL